MRAVRAALSCAACAALAPLASLWETTHPLQSPSHPPTHPSAPRPQGASVVLEGQRVVPTRAQDAGFQFKYATVTDALRNVLRS